jgi:DNA-binding GntR family transcriptional regulator
MSETSPSPNRPLGQVAYDQLHELIETGVLKPGDRVSVNGLADKLKISRTPVREAIAWLETDGLVVHEAYRGRVVGSLDRQMVTELYAMRSVLETTAAALAAQNASPAEIGALQEMLVLEEQVLDDPIRRERINRRFHQAIYASAHNRYLLATLKALQSPMVLLGPATASDATRVHSAFAEHRSLVEGISRRDAEAAREAMHQHLEGGQRTRMKELLAREPR